MSVHSIRLDLVLPDGTRQAILNSIRRYRDCCRSLYGVLLCAQAAGATITEVEDAVRITPNNDQAKIALAAALGAAKIEKGAKIKGAGQAYTVKIGAGLAYEMRSWFLQELYPDALSFVWDSARRDVVTTWTANDPEFPRANRGWLALQGARGIAQFQRRGIGIPVATGRPKLAERTLTLKWDREIGAVDFALPYQMDYGRYGVWKHLRDGDLGWKLGTIYLTERDGKIFAVLSHERPEREAAVDPARVCTVDVTDKAVMIAGPDAALDSISLENALALMAQLKCHREAIEGRRAACGNPRRPWGHRRGWQANQSQLEPRTRQRELAQKDINHSWSRRIVTRALAWRCGIIRVQSLPPALGAHPWQWSQFVEFLRYKAR